VVLLGTCIEGRKQKHKRSPLMAKPAKRRGNKTGGGAPPWLGTKYSRVQKGAEKKQRACLLHFTRLTLEMGVQ